MGPSIEMGMSQMMGMGWREAKYDGGYAICAGITVGPGIGAKNRSGAENVDGHGLDMWLGIELGMDIGI